MAFVCYFFLIFLGVLLMLLHLIFLMLDIEKENPWLVSLEDPIYDSAEPLYLELHATAILCLPSGECLSPDATMCAALMSALYSTVNEEVVLSRQLMVCLFISLCIKIKKKRKKRKYIDVWYIDCYRCFLVLLND